MWFISSFLPDWFITYFVHIVLAVGLILTFASTIVAKLPFISSYGKLVKPIGIVILLFAIYLEGGLTNELSWRAKVAEYQKQVEVAEAKAVEANSKIQTKVVTQIQVIKDTSNANKNAITQYVTDNCKLSNAAVMLHDSASQNEVPGSTISSIRGTSEVKVPELLTTVNDNYGTCYEAREKLKAWQDWYKNQKEIFESVK
jgi:uncharacterized integral membrane protein